jgi:hypothetical protein
MVPLKGGDGPKMLFNDMVDLKAGMTKVLEGALNRHPKASYEQCDNSACRFLAIFLPSSVTSSRR